MTLISELTLAVMMVHMHGKNEDAALRLSTVIMLTDIQRHRCLCKHYLPLCCVWYISMTDTTYIHINTIPEFLHFHISRILNLHIPVISVFPEYIQTTHLYLPANIHNFGVQYFHISGISVPLELWKSRNSRNTKILETLNSEMMYVCVVIM